MGIKKDNLKNKVKKNNLFNLNIFIYLFCLGGPV